jgi:hypothetical protein
MAMDRMSRTLWGMGWLGPLAALAALVTGFKLVGTGDEALPRHVLIALLGTLIVCFCHVWAGVYLWGLGRAIALTATEGGLGAEEVDSARRLRQRTLAWVAAALGLTLLVFALGGSTMTGTIPVPVHQALAWGALAAQLMALWSEGKAIAGTEGVLRSARELEA